MFDLFLKIPLQLQTIIITFGCIIIFVLLWKGYGIVKTKDGWSFSPKLNSDKKVGANKEINPHMQCDHFEDYKNTLFNLAKLSYKLAVMETKNDLIEMQLDYAIKKGDSMIGTLRSIYLNLLVVKTGRTDDITRMRSFVLYESLLEDIIQSKIFLILRTLFKKIDLAGLSEAAFRTEREENVKAIMQKITEIIDKKYIFDEEVTRVELYEANSLKKHEFINEFEDIFNQARMYAVEYNVKIEDINNKIMALLTGERISNELADIRIHQ